MDNKNLIEEVTSSINNITEHNRKVLLELKNDFHFHKSFVDEKFSQLRSAVIIFIIIIISIFIYSIW